MDTGSAGHGTHHDGQGVDHGTYEVLRDRLTAQAAELARATEELNARRTDEFGTAGLTLTGTDTLRTQLPCTPRDIVALGDFLLLGHDGPDRGEPQVSDVFTLYDKELTPQPDDALPGLLNAPDFVREFKDLRRYYRQARLLRLRRTEDRLLAVFRTGDKPGDIRVLRWSLDPAGRPEFIDARGERDHVPPPAHDFTWTEATRADHAHGHILVQGLRVSTSDGTLTVTAETGESLFAEPVTEPLQALADAELAHARVGALVLLRVRPYREDTHRHLVVDTLTGTAVRLDGIGQGARRLPDGQGIVFPGGYCLAGGGHKTFDVDVTGLAYDREIQSPYGEDVLYVFQGDGRALLLSYNTIRKETAAPLVCRGWARFDDGTLAVLRAADGESGRVHAVGRWASPYVSDTRVTVSGEGALGRIGNADLVRGVADCLGVARAAASAAASRVAAPASASGPGASASGSASGAVSAPGAASPGPTVEAYEALVAACVRAADTHHWLGEPELSSIGPLLGELRATAEQVLTEFRTVRALTRQAAEALDEAADRLASVVRGLRGEAPRTAAAWVGGLTELRRAQGHLLTLKELRYADLGRIGELAAEAGRDLDSFGRRAVTALAREDAFAEQQAEAGRLAADAEAVATGAEAAALLARIDDRAAELATLTEVVAGLEVGDATVRTAVLERIAEVLGGVNRARALLDARRRALRESEGRAEFTAELALLAQTVTGALAAAGTPDACDTQLAAVLVRLENLEARFAEFDDFLDQLTDRRAELSDTFAARKQTLLDARARRAEQLAGSARRVLETVARRAADLADADADAVSTYFASDPMVAKLRRTAEELTQLGDSVRAEEIAGLLKAARQDATRALRDRTDLYTDGGRTLRLGAHRFAVTTQPLDLTLVPDGDGLAFALAGTDYRAPVTDPAFTATKAFWNRQLPSESPEIYRSEHLAARLLPAAADTPDGLPALVRRAAQEAYDEGYERGVHDHDATAILRALLPLYETAGTLRHEPQARATALLHWAHGTTEAQRDDWLRRAVSLARAHELFGAAPAIAELEEEWAGEIGPAGAAYLFEELTGGEEGFVLGAAARTLLDKFRAAVGSSFYETPGDGPGTGSGNGFSTGSGNGPAAPVPVAPVPSAPLETRRRLTLAWLSAYATSTGLDITDGELAEAVAAELTPDVPRYSVEVSPEVTVDGLLGSHPRLKDGKLRLRIDEFLSRTRRFTEEDVPAFRAYQRRRTALVATERTRLRLDDHRPRPMTTFVRGRLVDEVYLPLIGDSLARQLGTAGEGRRTDTGGLLMLISPPGYGKTTLVEYVAERLGLMLVKVSGPALGHDVTSLDPAQAPNATARQEVEKINFALAAGTNTLLHVDDIQHCSPELLQKFIPLCDATRRIDGVWNGEPRTYDLRGKRFAVCMAGNPYTESGARFRVPDMLANRADVWNLGDVLTGKEDAFALSFLENALTSNPSLAALSGRGTQDLELFVRLAEQDPSANPDQLQHPYSEPESTEITAVVRHLLSARKTVLAVNAAYITSAARSDRSRTEPPFRLQGSYRTMNRIAQRIRPVMNGTELTALITDQFTADAQTLTTGAEENLLKLGELRGTLTESEQERWVAVKAAYLRERAGGGDPLIAALGVLAERVAAVEEAIARAARPAP